MARPGLDRNAKFRGLCRKLSLPRPHARGYLEYLWDVANESGNPVFESIDAIEASAEWEGEEGALAQTLIQVGFIDALNDGRFEIHDYWHHAPDYVYRRRKREEERQRERVCEHCGQPYRAMQDGAKFCSSACKQANYRVRRYAGVTARDTTKGNSDVTVTSRYPTPSPSPSPNNVVPTGTTSIRSKPTEYPPDFERFWQAYPKRKNKLDALKAWKQTKKDRPPIDELLEILEGLKGSKEWTKNGGEFVSYPATWLRAGGWEDEIIEPADMEPEYDKFGWSREERGLT